MNNKDASFLVLFLAPVREYLEDDKVSEILINGPSQIYIERGGKLQETDAAFASEVQLRAAAVNIAKSVDRQLDEMHPDLDARLPDGSRVHATIPPISRCGTIISIRKFKKEVLPLENGEYRMRRLMYWQTDALAPDGTVKGHFALGEKPSFAEDAEIMGIELPAYA